MADEHKEAGVKRKEKVCMSLRTTGAILPCAILILGYGKIERAGAKLGQTTKTSGQDHTGLEIIENTEEGDLGIYWERAADPEFP